jgi:hypothetical protein
MRKGRCLIVLAGLLGPTVVLSAGCIDALADYYTPLTDPKLATWNDGGPEGGDAGDSGDGGDADGSKPDCSGDPSDTNVIDECGVFAQADATAPGDGSMATPFAKLADAIAEAQAKGKRVYACTSQAFAEAVTISAGIEVYGGFDCTNGWAWSRAARAELDGPPDAIPLTIEASAGGAKIEGFTIKGASPSTPMMGGSSIAVTVADVTATLEDCDLTAADAADGADGTTPTTPVSKGADAPMPVHGQEDACINPASLVGGAAGTTTMCGSIDTSGGLGGKGGITGIMGGYGQNGASGANPAAMPKMGTDGLGGAGQTDPAGTCQTGDPGAPGSSGTTGNGGSVLSDTLSIAGISNGDDTDGHAGTPGQGGGGGGGAMSGMFCLGGVDGNGASGGGGGAGGCGGLGGGGGKAGGSSIAIVSLGTKLTLMGVTLAVGTAGDGGKGVIGQGGGLTGAGATGGAPSGLAGSLPGCRGGDGGLGGAGGPGGGGRGGHAIGIAYTKTPATVPVLQMFTPGMPGTGGTAGSGAPTTSNGALGNAGPCWDFSTNAACAM